MPSAITFFWHTVDLFWGLLCTRTQSRPMAGHGLRGGRGDGVLHESGHYGSGKVLWEAPETSEATMTGQVEGRRMPDCRA